MNNQKKITQKTVTCGCGEVYGEPCAWSGPIEDMVIVEYMPEYLRASHKAARNRGYYPQNGSVRFRAEQSCAERIVADDPDWASTVGPEVRS